MAQVIDARGRSDSGVVSKRLFNERVKQHARRAIYKSIEKGNITDIGKGGVDVEVHKDDLNEPVFGHGEGGLRQRVHPGNKEFRSGQRIPRPKGGGSGSGSGKASPDGEGEDSFVYHLSQEEFLDILFEDLALPNMRRLNVDDTQETEAKFAGFSTGGQMSQLDLIRSKRRKMGRILAAEQPINKDILGILEEQRDLLSVYADAASPKDAPADIKPQKWMPQKVTCKKLSALVQSLSAQFLHVASDEVKARFQELEDDLLPLTKKRSLIPSWNEMTDLRFRNYPPQPIPTNKAVMFCVMDVSGSMDEDKKTKAKIFYYLLYKYLERNHENVELRFIRHHTSAKEVDEHEFFYGKESGGTVVSPALKLMDDIVTSDYKGKNYDVYMAQASDGDNTENDNPVCDKIMTKILGYTRGAFYTEITHDAHQNLWNTYEKLQTKFTQNFWMGKIEEIPDIWPLFRKFFAKKYGFENTGSNKAAFELNHS